MTPLVTQLIEALRGLPGVGPKSAQRMVFHWLERDRSSAERVAQLLPELLTRIQHCASCRMFSEDPVCGTCRHPHRQSAVLCVVESPLDVFAIEQTASYKGHYFVLSGALSPIEGRGPDEVGMPVLLERLKHPDLKEIILATSATLEGEATAFYIQEHAKHLRLRISKLAQGVPLGSALEFVDTATLARALQVREPVSS